LKSSKLKVYPGCKIKFNLQHPPYLRGLGTILEMYSGEGVPCVYSLEIQEVEGHDIFQAGEHIFIFAQEIEKIVYFE